MQIFAPVIVCILFKNLVSKGILSHSLFSHQESIYYFVFGFFFTATVDMLSYLLASKLPIFL